MRAGILLALFVIPFCSYAQDQDEASHEIRFTFGKGAYAQGDLKTLQILQEGPYRFFGLKVTDNFPPYYFVGAELRFLLKHGSLGVASQFESTGYRSIYSDYSGSMEFGQKASSFNLGAVGSVDCYKGKKFGVALETQANMVFSSVDISSSLELMSAPLQSESYGFKSTSVLFRPALDVSYRLFPAIVVHAIGGYAIDLRGAMKLKSNSDTNLMLSSKSSAKTDWTGWRIGLSVAIQI